MATRPRKISESLETNDPWRQVSEPIEMQNGVMAIHWRNVDTGTTRIVPAGMHPDDQALESYALAEQEDEPLEETATDRVAAMLSTVNGSADERAEVKVYRVKDGALEYCRGFKPAEFEDGNFDMLRDRYGSGLYELRLYATSPTTRKFAVRNKLRVTIAEEILNPHNAPATGGMGQALEAITRGQQAMLDALLAIKQAPPKDPMEEMGKMLTMMAAMREAMGMNQSQTREKSSIGEIVSAIRELRGAADELSPAKEEPDNLMAMLPRVLDLVSASQNSQQAAAAATFPPVTIPPGIAQPAEQPQPLETQENADMKALALLKLHGYLKTLQTMAKEKKTVKEGAEFVYEKLPDELIDIMALENWFDLLSGVSAECTPHKEWFTQVRDAALAMFDNGETEPH